MVRNVLLELLLPLLGTFLGAGCVFFLKKDLNPLVPPVTLHNIPVGMVPG